MVTVLQATAAGTLSPMGDGGLQFRLAGFPVHLPVGGIIGVLLIAYLWAPTFDGPGRSGLVTAMVFGVLLYLGVLVHELAHAWAARAFGFPVQGITLWLLGGYTVYERRNARPWPELVIAVVGPLSTLGIALVCWALAAVTAGTTSLVLDALAWTNTLLGALNLLPGAPLDGGGVVKAIVWRITGSERAGSRASGYAGLIIAALLGLLAVTALLSGTSGMLLTLVLALFIGFGAVQSLRSARTRQAFDQVTADIPRLIRPVLAVSDRDMLGAALDRWDQRTQVAVVTVDDQGRLLAALSLPAADAVPLANRPQVAVGPFTVAIPADQRGVYDDPDGLLRALSDSGQPAVFVVDGSGRPLGVLLATDVNQALRQH